MLERYYIQVLSYLNTTSETDPTKFDIEIPRPVLNATIEELSIKQWVSTGKFYVSITEKGKAYLDLNDLYKKEQQNKIIAMQTQPFITRVKKISLVEWGAIWTIVAGVIAFWIYVVEPFIESLVQ